MSVELTEHIKRSFGVEVINLACQLSRLSKELGFHDQSLSHGEDETLVLCIYHDSNKLACTKATIDRDGVVELDTDKTGGKTSTLSLVQVDTIPEKLEQGSIYVSFKYRTVIHLCPCGCGNQSVTPFSEGEWNLTVYDDGSVSMKPSILNTNCPNKSHYWIENSRVRWAT